MLATLADMWNTNVRELRAQDFADGLDISAASFRAHTSFLEALDKVIPIDRYIFTCMRNSDGKWYDLATSLTNGLSYYQTVDYYTAKTNKEPVQDFMILNSNAPGVQLNCPNGKTSDPNISVEERPFKNLVLDLNGSNFTYTNESKQCFGDEGDVRKFTLRILN